MREFEVTLVRKIMSNGNCIESKVTLLIKAPRFDYALQNAKNILGLGWHFIEEYKF